MLASIHPLGERARGHRWGWTVTWYLLGSTAGGATLGALVGTARLRAGPAVVVALCLGAALVEASGLRPPGWRRQVDEVWLSRYRGWVYGLGFGYQLGLGVVTIVSTAAVYLAFVLAGLSGGAAPGALIGATFGFTRALPVLALGGVREPARLRRLHAKVAAAAPWSQRVTVAALVAAAVGGGLR